MKTRKYNNKGFTMVELLVVLVIVGILAAVATPIFLGNTQKARASEAVATMSLIRQAQRDFFINNNKYIVPIQNTEAKNIGSPPEDGVAVNTGVAQYFDNLAFEVVDPDAASAPFTNPKAQDFVVRVTGAKSKECKGDTPGNCALKRDDVQNYRLEMDNTGRIFVSYGDTGEGGGAKPQWQKY